MITFLVNNYNTFSQKTYDKFLDKIQFHQLSCPCGNIGNLKIHGYYRRSIKTHEGKITLNICRVKCPYCSKTHALLPSFIVPYSQISLTDHIDIITASSPDELQTVMNANLLIDESNCSYIRRQFKKLWQQRLLSYGISIIKFIPLIKDCFKAFSRQFMQIKGTSNILFSKTT